MSTNEFEIRNIRLLLVEDNPADARVVERHLKDAGLNQVTSDCGANRRRSRDSVCRRWSTTWCCSISGCPMPPACEALRALRAVADLTPIIVLTGSDDYKQGLSAVREGAQDYLEKRRVNAGMLSRIVSYSVERNNFHRDLVRATRRYQDCSTTCRGVVHRQPGWRAQDRERGLREAAVLPGHSARPR